MARVNKAAAAFEALVNIENHYRRAYVAPLQIEAPEYFAHESGTTVTVVVREGYGPVAIYTTVKDFDTESPVVLGRMTQEELKMVNAGQFLLPEWKDE